MGHVQVYRRSLKNFCPQKSNQKTSTSYQPQTQSTSVTLNPNINIIGTTESIYPTEVTGFSFSTSFAQVPGITLPLQVLIKIIRSNSDINIEPDSSEKCTSQDNFSGVTSHQFDFQSAADLIVSPFMRTQRNIPIYIPFTEYNNQIRNNQTSANQPTRSNGQSFVLNTITTTVSTMLRPPVAPLNFVDT